MAHWPQLIENDDLLSCDREAIHLIGAIQPVGFLLAVDVNWVITRASENVALFLGADHQRVLGQAAQIYIADQVLHDIRGCLQIGAENGVVGRLFGQVLAPAGPPFDVAVHRSGCEFVLEFEESAREAGGSLADLRSMIAGVERQNSVQALVREAARHVRAFTDFDRVMIYRFDESGSGEVIAESAKSGLPPFMSLHFPATDIPVQARALYERCYLRSIADVDAVSSAVSPALSPEGERLDLSMSTLRSVSPIHIEYLKNMGVRSSMSISILRSGRLWGLIACHHGMPKSVNYEMRSTAELFGQMFSYLLDEHERQDESVIDTMAEEIHDRAAVAFAAPGSILDNLPDFLASVVGYIPSDGAGIFMAGKIALTGLTPERKDFRRLIADLDRTAAGTIYSTHKLGDVFPDAAEYTARAAGIIAIPISRSPHGYLVFFRQEIVRTVTWAGRPDLIKTTSPNGTRLTPRSSFEAWQEIVQGQSLQWTPRELRLADVLRATLLALALGASHTIHADRTGTAQRQEVLIAALNHRNRNILGLVRGLITQSAVSALDVKALVESLDDRIRSLACAHDVLTSGHWKPASLHILVRAEISTYSQSETNLKLVGPDIMLQPQAYSAMAMVVHELVTNARKHGALTGPRGLVNIETARNAQDDVTIVWRETGGPAVSPPTRRGFGSTILEQAIPFEVNGLSTPRYPRGGFELEIILPAAVAACAAAGPLVAESVPTPGDDGDFTDDMAFAALLRTTLVVEDNLFIALDAQDLLHRLGAGTTDIMRTVSGALDILKDRRFTFALLDVNLGVETSLPIALALKAQEIPFIFGTGYGEALGMPATLKDVPIVAKPYSRQTVRTALMRFTTPTFSSRQAAGTSIAPSTMRAPSGRMVHDNDQAAFALTADGRLDRRGRRAEAVQALDVDWFFNKLESLSPISTDDKKGLTAVMMGVRSLAAGTDILHAGGRPDGLYVVQDGLACRYRLARDGARQITSYLVPGDFCDLSSISGRMADALGTISPCKVAHVSKESLQTVMLRHPTVAHAFQQSALVDQAVSREWLVNLGRRSAEGRLAHLFCELLTRMQDVGAARANECSLPLTQYDLGDTLGLSLVHVNRTMQSLRQQGLISLKSKVLTVLDLPRLAALAGFRADYLHVDRHP